MSIQTSYSARFPWKPLAALTALSMISTLHAENPPPCDPCKIEVKPSAIAADIDHEVVRHRVDGIAGFTYDVTWKTNTVPKGAYWPTCANVNGEGLQSFDGWYNPTQMTKSYRLSAGKRVRAQSDFFEAFYFDPCVFSARKSGGNTEHNFWLEGTPANPNEREPKVDPPLPPLPPIITDPYEEETETKDPCPPPFVPGQFSPYRNIDNRQPSVLPAPTQVEIVAENISFSHQKNGFLQYDYNSATTLVPRYFLKETAITSLSGGTPESPVGGTIIRQVHPMTGQIIETAKAGNPSWYGPRAGPNVALTATTAAGSFEVESYDDCPNLEDDTPGTINFTSTLTDEYTKEKMLNDTFAHAWGFRGNGYYLIQNASAALWISDSQEEVTYWKTIYKIRVPTTIARPYKALWVEEFTPDDPDPNDSDVPEKKYDFK